MAVNSPSPPLHSQRRHLATYKLAVDVPIGGLHDEGRHVLVGLPDMGKRRGGGFTRPGRGRSAEHGPEPVAESPCVNRDDNAAGHFKVPVKGSARS